MSIAIGQYFVSYRMYGRADMVQGSVGFDTLAAAQAYARKLARAGKHAVDGIYRRDAEGTGYDKFTRLATV